MLLKIKITASVFLVLIINFQKRSRLVLIQLQDIVKDLVLLHCYPLMSSELVYFLSYLTHSAIGIVALKQFFSAFKVQGLFLK